MQAFAPLIYHMEMALQGLVVILEMVYMLLPNLNRRRKTLTKKTTTADDNHPLVEGTEKNTDREISNVETTYARHNGILVTEVTKKEFADSTTLDTETFDSDGTLTSC